MRNTYQHTLILGICTLFVVALSLAVAPASQAAGPWYVAPTGSDNNLCNSPNAPCATLQGVINKSNGGDTINAAIGLYTGNGNEVALLNKNLSVLGGWNSDFSSQIGFSIIDGGNTRRGVVINFGITANLNRFIIQNGRGIGGSGVYNAGTFIIENSVVRANHFPASVSIGLGGGGLFNSGDLNLHRVSVIDNSIDGAGGGLYNAGTAKINNSTFSANNSIWGGGIYNTGASLIVRSSTIYNNRATNGGGLDTAGGTITLQNTALTGNSSADCITFYDGTPGPISQGYNLIGTTVGCHMTTHPTDKIGVDAKLNPYLVGLPGYHPVMPDSPAIDAGSPGGCLDASGVPITIDQRGQPRDAQCDIGAYEYLPPGPVVSLEILDGTPQHTLPGAIFRIPFKLFAVDAKGTPATGAKVAFLAPSTGVGGSFSGTGTYTTTATIDGAGVVTATTFTANQLTGIYTITATAGISAPVRIFTVGNTLGLYVSSTGSAAAYCWIPSMPCASVNEAISKAWPGDTIYATTGSYTSTESAVVHFTKSITLTAGWDSAFVTRVGYSVFDGGGVRRVMLTNPGIAVNVDWVVLQNGYNPINEGYAGGLHNQAVLTLTDSIVTQNGGFTGIGGISNVGGVLTLNRTRVTHNPGGGILNGTDFAGVGTVILNSAVVAYNNGYYGGVFNAQNSDSILVINNSSIFNNQSDAGSGGITNNGIAYVNSSSITNNRAGYSAGGLVNLGGGITVTNSIVSGNRIDQGVTDCVGSIVSRGYNIISTTNGCGFAAFTGDKLNINPAVVPLGNTVALVSGSPAIDAGNPSGCKNHLGITLTTDQRGRPRPVDGNADTVSTCDIGAYEYSPTDPVRQVFLPVIRRPKPRLGLNGTVTQNGAPAVNVPLDLRFYNGSFWSTWTSTTTDADGDYFFTGVPSLAPGQRYYVRFQNSAGGDSSRLWTWHTRSLTSYVAGSDVALGSFDIANIALVSPASGANVTLPRTFQWLPRPATPTDNYEFNLYDPNDFNPYFFTNPPLGYVSSYTLANLPPGFGVGPIYAWEIWVYGGEGSFGVSYETRGVYFANSGAILTADLPTGATKYNSEFESQWNLDLQPKNP